MEFCVELHASHQTFNVITDECLRSVQLSIDFLANRACPTLSQMYPHWNWNSKLNTNFRLEFQGEYGFKLEFQVE